MNHAPPDPRAGDLPQARSSWLGLDRPQVGYRASSSILATTALLIACSRANPITGSWTLSGPRPTPDPIQVQWTAITFRDNHDVMIDYIPALSPFAVFGAAAGAKNALNPKPEIQRGTYEDLGNGEIRIVEGSQAANFKIDVREDRLYLTPVVSHDEALLGGAPTTVFVRRR